MSGISPQQKEGSSIKEEEEEKKRSKDWKAKEVKPHLKSSMFQKEKRKRGWQLQAARRDSIEIK
jgi:hypothetical protein